MPYLHDDLCQHTADTQRMLDPRSCVFCQVIVAAIQRERTRQFPDPFLDAYLTEVEGRP